MNIRYVQHLALRYSCTVCQDVAICYHIFSTAGLVTSHRSKQSLFMLTAESITPLCSLVSCAGISAENAILNVAILIVCIWVSRLYLCRQKYNCLLSYCSKIATKQLSTLPFSCSWNLCLKSSSQGRASAMTNGLDSNTTAQHYGNWVCQADSKLIINTSI